MRKECANQNCPKPDRQIEPERARWADYCLECAAERKRHWRQKKKQDNPLYTGYNPKNAQRRRESFHKRDPAGRTDSQRVADWRKRRPERAKEQNRNAAEKRRFLQKHHIKAKFKTWNPHLKDSQIKLICRHCTIEELPRLAELLDNWATITNNAIRLPHVLVNKVKNTSGEGGQVTRERGISNRMEL